MPCSKLLLIDINESVVIQAAINQKNTLKNPPLTIDEYLQSLAKQKLTQTAEILGRILLR